MFLLDSWMMCLPSLFCSSSWFISHLVVGHLILDDCAQVKQTDLLNKSGARSSRIYSVTTIKVWVPIVGLPDEVAGLPVPVSYTHLTLPTHREV